MWILKRLFSQDKSATETSSPPNTSASKTEPSFYSADQPITSKEEDRFSRWPFAQRIAETIARRQDPSSLVLGIYGVWGDGKTSALRLMEVALKDYPHVVLVPFNPWHFQSEAQLIRGFFETLAGALGKSLPTRAEDVGRLLKRYGGILSVASISLGVAAISPGEGLRKLGEALSTVELDTLKERLERILDESRKRVVVLIDDIDRLDREEIQAIFKLVKLSAGFRHTVYVLAFDDEVVADALGEKYGRGGVEAGRSFLEKIIQVPLHLPPADELALRQLTLEGVDAALRLSVIELSEEQAQGFVHHFVDGFQRMLTTPRQAKRYANVVAFALPILKGEVNTVDQMLLEGVRVFYPKLYVVIRENPDLFLSAGRERRRDQAGQQRALEIIGRRLEGLNAVEQEAAKDLLQVLFPRLKGLFGNTVYNSEWDERWAREQRICSDAYFHRYFRYSVPAGDVADQEVTRFIEQVASGDEAEIVAAFGVLAKRGAPRFITKLRLREGSVEPETAKRLALSIAKSAAVLPREKTLFGFESTFSQAALLTMKLLRRIPVGPERENLAREIVKAADPLPFAFDCFRFFESGENEPESERLLSVAVEKELGTLLATRIKEAATVQPPYVAFPESSPYLLLVWSTYGPQGEVSAYLIGRFAANLEETTKFLVTYVPTAWGGESGLPHKSDLRRDSYDAIAKVVDPTVVIHSLKTIYSAELDNPQYHPSREMPVERRAAHQFTHIHQTLQADSPQRDAEAADDAM